MPDICNDNRFELIEKYKQQLIECTNIETAPDEMAVINDILFRFWQMGWLDKLERPEQRWIPCEEALPEEDDCIVQCSDDVLITVVNTMDEETIVDYGRTTDGKWYSETADRFIPHGWKPIAWMPLPEPWKEKKNETN